MLSSTTETEVCAPSPALLHGKVDIAVQSTDFGILPIPKRLRYDPEKPFHFGLVLNAAFGFASTFTVANLYYCQPLLIELSKYFDVSYSRVSTIPTLVQAGYATGLLLISPLGDLVRRRQLILLLVLMSTTFTIGLSITPNFLVFEALCFLIGVTSVTPQILMPLAADLATQERRASALSVVLSGLMLGILMARVLAGVIGNFNTWRIVYYMAIGIQCLVLVGAFLVLPDYPSKNRDLTYLKILYTMAKYVFTEPLLVQTALINIASSACFTSFWVTLTFLLGGPPYYYSTLDIGLFGLVGMFGVLAGPFTGRLIDNLVPWYATLVATFVLVVFQSVQTAAGGINISAVIIPCFGLDAARQMQLVSLTTAVFSISTAARARLNAILVLSASIPFRDLSTTLRCADWRAQLFIGQVMGTAVGTRVFLQHGWRAWCLLMLALYAFQLMMLMLRGPHCPRNHWFGWTGGFEARKSVVEARNEDGTPKFGTPTCKPQPPEKMEDGLVWRNESRDAAHAA